MRNKAYTLAAELKLETWQDAAIRNLAQDQRSPLYIAATGDTRLDDVAAESFSLAPQDIARLGLAVAANVTGDRPDALAQSDTAAAERIADALRGAQRPLIVSGTSCGDAAVMTAAAQLASALCAAGKQAMLCLTVPEANSLGQALLCGPEATNLTALQRRVVADEIDTLVVLENDLYRRGAAPDIDQLLSVPNLIVLDLIDHQTASASSLALPAASFAESEGTLVNMWGRAQRHFPVFQPREQRRPSWEWLLACLQGLARPGSDQLRHFDDISAACARDHPVLADITAAAPDHLFRNLGVKIPRQTHRYSGRTAMLADVSVHEPKQPEDTESPLAFTMEGLNRHQPGALLPYVWAPGWNSNQSLHKFQSEVGGALSGGTAGVRLLDPSAATEAASEIASDLVSQLASQLEDGDTPEAHHSEAGQWQLVARYRIFGSDELSALSPGVAELVDRGFLELSSTDAESLGLETGDGVQVGAGLATLEVRINNHIAMGCAGFSTGLPEALGLVSGARVALTKAADWRRQPQVIGSDGGARD